jgi:hypothetical protein
MKDKESISLIGNIRVNPEDEEKILADLKEVEERVNQDIELEELAIEYDIEYRWRESLNRPQKAETDFDLF